MSQQWRNLFAAFAAITVFGFTFGMTHPLLSLLLEADGVAPDMIGINAAMTPIGILLISSLIPVAAARFGARQVALSAAIVTIVVFPAFKLFDDLATWFVLRLFIGMSTAVLFVLSEAWIVRFAGNRHRGKVIAIYGSVLAASFGAGPAIVSLIGIDGWLPFLIGVGVLAVGLLPLLLIREGQQTVIEQAQTSGLLNFAGKAPMLLLAVLVFAIFDAATLSLLPVYGLQNGLDTTSASALLAALILGNVVLQFPIGWCADRFPKRAVTAVCAMLTSLVSLSLPFVMNTVWMWPAIVVIGAAGYGVYTVSLAALGDRFSGRDLVTGSSAFAVVWGIGALSGSVLGGWSMAVAAVGYPLFLAATYLLLTGGLALRAARLRS